MDEPRILTFADIEQEEQGPRTLTIDDVEMGKPRPAPPKPKQKVPKLPRKPVLPYGVTMEDVTETITGRKPVATDPSKYKYHKRPTLAEQMREGGGDPVVITGRRPPKPPRKAERVPGKSDEVVDPVTGQPLGPPALEQPGWIEHTLNKALRIPQVFPKMAESAGEAVDALVYGLGRLEGGTPEEIAQRQTRLTPYIKKVTTPIQEFIRGFAPQDPAKQGYAADIAAGGLASAGEFLLAGWTGKAIGVPSKVVSGTVGAGLNINEALAEADKLGASPDQRAALVALSGLTGLTEMAGLGKTIEGFGLSRLFKQRVNEVLEEGGQEALQTWLNNLNMVVTRVDPNRPLTRDVLESAMVGGFVGGVFQGVSYGTERLFAPKQQPDLPPVNPENIAKIPPPPGYVPPPPRQRPVPKSMMSTKLQPGPDMMLMSRGDETDYDKNLNRFLENSQIKTPVYHGTSSRSEISEIDPSKFDDDPLWTPGFYTTQSPDIAAGEGGYVEKEIAPPPLHEKVDMLAKFADAHLKDLGLNLGVDELKAIIDNRQPGARLAVDARQVEDYLLREGIQHDIHKVIDATSLAYQDFMDWQRTYRAGKPHAYKLYVDIWNPFRPDDPFTMDQLEKAAPIIDKWLGEDGILVTSNMRDRIMGNPTLMDDLGGNKIVDTPPTGADFFRKLRSAGMEKSEIGELLREMGYDGITHMGGLRVGSEPKIFKDEKEALTYSEQVGGRYPKYVPYWGDVDLTNYPALGRFMAQASGMSPNITTTRTSVTAINDAIEKNAAPVTQEVLDQYGKLVYDNSHYEVTGHTVWIAFNPNQVKSATGNSGGFNPTDPRIYQAQTGVALTYDPKSDDMAFDVMPALSTEYARAPYLRAPRWVMKAAKQPSDSGGFNRHIGQLNDLLYQVMVGAPSPAHADLAVQSILDLAEQAKEQGITTLSVIANDTPEDLIRGVIEHEVLHSAERLDLHPTEEWAAEHPLLEDVLNRQFAMTGQTVRDFLFPDQDELTARWTLAMEIPAYYAQGQVARLGMSEEEGRQFFKDYVNHVRTEHGQEGVDLFRRTVRLRDEALAVITESDNEWKQWQQEVRERGPERSAALNDHSETRVPVPSTLYARGDLVYPPNVRVDDVVRRVGDAARARVVATHNDGVFVQYLEGPHEGMSQRLPWSMTIEADDPALTPQEQVRREIERKPVIPPAGETIPRIGGKAGLQQNSSPVFQLGQVVRALDKEGEVMDEDMTIVELDTDEYGPLVRAQRHDDGGVGEFRLDRIMLASDVGKPTPQRPKLQKYDPTKGKERMAAKTAATVPPQGPSGPEPPQLPPSGGGRPFRHPRIMTDRMDNDYQRAVDRAYKSLLEKGGVTLDPTRRVFLQVVDALEEGKISSEQFDEALEENGMTLQQFIDEYKVTVHEAALTLYELSRIKIKYKNIIKANKNLADKFLSVADQFDALMDELNDTILGKNVWQRGSSLIRMMMLSDLRTAFVNAWVTTGRIPLSIVNHGLGAFMHSMHKSKDNPHGLRDRLKVAAQDFNRATKIGIEVLLSLKPSELVQNREKTPTGGKHLEYQQVIDQLIKQFPDLHGRLIAPGIGDVGVSQLGTKLDEARTLAGTIKDLPSREKALNDLKKFEDRHRSNMNNWMKKGLYGAEWGLEWMLTPMRWQELLFRRPMFVAYLNYALEKRNLNFADLASRNELSKIPEEVLNEAVDEALDFTYSYMPHADEKSPWGEKRAAEFINAINRLGPISAMAGIAFPRAVYNGVKFVYEYSPLGAMPYFVKKFRQKTGRDIIHDPTLPNVSYQAQGTALTERDFQRVAKAMVGTLMFATAMGLIKAGLIGDEWWKLKVPFGTKLTDSGNPLYLDLRKFQPLSTFARLADMSMRAGASLLDTDAFGRQRGDMHMGQELKEIFTGMRNFPGLEESTNAFFEMWDDGTGASWDKGMQSVGMSLSWMTRPLINVRDAVAIFMDEEQKQKDLKGTGLWGPLVDNVPWLRTYLLENKTDPNKGVVENMFAPALSFPMGAKMIEGENFAGREWRRLGLLNKTFLPSESDPIMNRARNQAFFEFMDEVAAEFENDPAYLEASDDDKAAMWEIMAKEARPIANEAGKAANPEEDAKAKAREASGMGPKQRKAAGFEDELK